MASIGYMNRQAQLSVLNQAERLLNDLEYLKNQRWKVTQGARKRRKDIERTKKENKIIFLLLFPTILSGSMLGIMSLIGVFAMKDTTLWFVPFAAIIGIAIIITLLKTRVKRKNKKLAKEVAERNPDLVRIDNAIEKKMNDIVNYYNNYKIPSELVYIDNLVYIRDYLSKFPEKSLGSAFDSLSKTRAYAEIMRNQRQIDAQLQANRDAINANTKVMKDGINSINETIRNSELGIRITMADYLR